VKKVLVIGDVIADVYTDVETVEGKFCPDAPDVPVVVETRREIRPGGAANVAVNLAALTDDVLVDLIGVVTPEVSAAIYGACLGRLSLTYAWSWSEDGITKERLYIDGRLTTRIDRQESMAGYTRECLISAYKSYIRENNPDLILISDYGCGTVGGDLFNILMGQKRHVIVDTKRSDLSVFSEYKGVATGKTLMVKLNESEWKAAAARDPMPERHFDWMVVTKGSVGATLTWRNDMPGNRSVAHSMDFPAYDVPTVDVCGSGDTFLAGMTAGLLATGDVPSAVKWGNAAAATVVGQPRTAVASRVKMLELLGRNSDEVRG